MNDYLGMNLVIDERRTRRRFRPKRTGMLAMLLKPPVLRSPLPRPTSLLDALASLQKRLEQMFELRNPLPQFGVLGLQFGNPSITRVVHDPHSLPENAISGKSRCLTVTLRCTM